MKSPPLAFIVRMKVGSSSLAPVLADELEPGSVGRRSARLPATPPQSQRSSGTGRRGPLVGELGRADAWLAADEEEMPAPARRASSPERSSSSSCARPTKTDG